MQQLHLVGFTTDSDSLILSAKKGARSGSFVVPLDERLLEVIADAVRRRNAEAGEEELHAPPELLAPPEPPKRTSRLSPREIQARLRAGRSVGEVAREAATDEDWVAKFAPPVLAERARVVARVRDLVFTKPRRGPSGEPLGLSVRWNLAERGIRLIDDEYDGSWSAFHIGDSLWGITFDFVSRGRRQRAEWEVDFADEILVARNRVATDLAYLEPGRRRRLSLTPEPPKPARSSEAARAIPAGRATHAGRVATKAGPKITRATSAANAKQATSAAKRTTAPKSTTPTRATKRSTKTRTTSATKPGNATKSTKATKSAGSAKAARVSKPVRKAAAGQSTKATRQRNAASARTAKSTGAAKGGRGGRPVKRAARPRGSIATGSSTAERAASSADVESSRVAARPVVSELDRRRLELVRARAQPAHARMARASSANATRPRNHQDQTRVARPPSVQGSAAAPTAQVASRTDAAGTSEAPSRTGSAGGANAGASGPDATRAAEAAEEAARARREDRRRARAERLAQERQRAAAPIPSAQLPEDSSIPSDEGRVVTIRASRAGGGDVIVPGGPRQLRPAQPAVQPKRRRFTRNR